MSCGSEVDIFLELASEFELSLINSLLGLGLKGVGGLNNSGVDGEEGGGQDDGLDVGEGENVRPPRKSKL